MKTKYGAIAIIPARGGSKGVPRKNILPLAGKPLIEWTIMAAKKVADIERVVVTTDDLEIEEISSAAGAEVVKRPVELATDTATSESAILHALSEIEKKDGTIPQYTVFLQCTSPMTTPEDIAGTLAKLYDGADSALTVTNFYHFVWKENGGRAHGINHDSSERLRRQEREPEWLETGSVYAFKTDQFRENKHRFFGKIKLHPIESVRVLEIDEPEDFALAEMKMSALKWVGQ